MEILIKAAQLILSLSILVVLHEFGHFLPARFFKIRVEKFYLFFNPWFSVVKKKIKDTEWGIGWLPLGGYVKISGMIDESMDTEQMSQPAQPWEFRSKPAWQRLIVMIGGVVVNIIVGFFIYILVLFTWGDQVVDLNKLSNGMSVHPYMEKYKIYSGDVVTKVDGEPVININDINRGILLRGARELTVLKPNGESKVVKLPDGIDYELFKEGAYPAFSMRGSHVGIQELPGSVNQMKDAGFKAGDQIIGCNDTPITFYDELETIKYKNKRKTLNLSILRGSDTLNLKAKVDSIGKMGFLASMELEDSLAISNREFGLGESFGAGMSMGYWTLNDYVSQLKFIFTKKGASSIGGFAAIGNLFPPAWDWHQFWLTTALISIILAFMNILPIPALDGGHVVFLLYEMITGKEAPQKVLEYAQYVGIILLLGLLIYANGNDLYRWLAG